MVKDTYYVFLTVADGGAGRGRWVVSISVGWMSSLLQLQQWG